MLCCVAAGTPQGSELRATLHCRPRFCPSSQQARPLAHASLVAALAAAQPAAATCALHDMLACFLEVVVTSMADHVALLAIVRRLLLEHGSASFGDFRATLLGLLGACAYEAAILGAANRLVGKDAFRQVAEKRAERTRGAGGGGAAAALAVVAAAEEAGGTAHAPPAAYAAAGAAAPGMSSAVASAWQLGVLGWRSGGAGGMGGGGNARRLLPMSPDGSAPAGEFGVALHHAAARRQGRRFYGRIDLAAEIAALHHAANLGHIASSALPGSTKRAGGGSANADAGAAAALAAGSAVASNDSFDVDELLQWSAAHQ